MSVNRKTKPKVWQPTFLHNRALCRELRSEIARSFSPEKTSRILDVGCGAMPYRELFASRCREYVGCDLYADTPGVLKCPADDITAADESFDAVVSFQVL